VQIASSTVTGPEIADPATAGPRIAGRPLAPAWASVTWAVAMLCAMAGLVLSLLAGSAPDAVNPTPRGIVALFSISFALAATVGAVIVRRAAGHSVGVLVLVAGTSYAAGLAAEGYAKLRAADEQLDVGTALASWLDLTSWRLGAVLLAIALALFPERRPDSPFTRWLVILLIVDGVAVVAATALTPGPLGAGTYQDNPLSGPSLTPLVDAVAGPAEALSWALTALAVGSVVWRYVRAPAGARRQLRWPALLAALLLVGLLIALLGFAGGVILQVIPFLLSVVGLPIAMAAAILSDHLFDIDVIVNRFVVYLMLAATITAVYVATVVAAQLLFLDAEPPTSLITIASLVVVSLIALPARDRLQRLADRMLFGRRSTPYHALASFAEMSAGAWSLRDTAPRLASLLADATGASLAVVYIRADDRLLPVGREPGPASGLDPVSITDIDATLAHFELAAKVERGGELLGAMAVTLPPGRPARPAERRLISQLAAQAALVFETLRLTSELSGHAQALAAQAAELRQSRLRLVMAQDAERSRIGRDLHDGAQQHLLAIIAKAGLARSQLTRDTVKAGDTLGGLQQDTKFALVEIRELVHGIFPPILADRGLVVAVEQRAARLPIDVTVDADPGDRGRRFEPSLESAAWFVISEALTNVVKHAQARHVTVRFRLDRSLDVDVIDDGVGIADMAAGMGLTGMADRVAALDGAFRVDDVPGGGTAVSFAIPLQATVASDARSAALVSRAGVT
jgi:signal transduction histidine kinase